MVISTSWESNIDHQSLIYSNLNYTTTYHTPHHILQRLGKLSLEKTHLVLCSIASWHKYVVVGAIVKIADPH